MTGQDYSISGEYQGKITKRSLRGATNTECVHDFQNERILGAQTGDWSCVKCGHVRSSQP